MRANANRPAVWPAAGRHLLDHDLSREASARRGEGGAIAVALHVPGAEGGIHRERSVLRPPAEVFLEGAHAAHPLGVRAALVVQQVCGRHRNGEVATLPAAPADPAAPSTSCSPWPP